MGKGGASAKDAKKAVRAALDAKEKERTAKVKAALTAGGAPRNVLADLAPFAKFDRNGLVADITQASVEDAATWSPELEAAVFELTKANMREMYEAAPGWGWSDKKKRAELFAPDMRFLVARSRDAPPGAPPLGFVAFSFLLEGEYDAAYVFELQLALEAKRRGLGRHLMACVELAARKAGMQWVFLTVFKANGPALAFYMSRLKYDIADISPSRSGGDDGEGDGGEAPYEILAKCVDAAGWAAYLAWREGIVAAAQGGGGKGGGS